MKDKSKVLKTYRDVPKLQFNSHISIRFQNL